MIFYLIDGTYQAMMSVINVAILIQIFLTHFFRSYDGKILILHIFLRQVHDNSFDFI